MVPAAFALFLFTPAEPGGPRLENTITVERPAPSVPIRVGNGFLRDGNFVGVGVGADGEDTALYLRLTPRVDLSSFGGRLRVGVELPVYFTLYDAMDAAMAQETSGGFSRLGAPTLGDYDGARDYVRLVRHLAIETDHFRLRASRERDDTAGGGHVVRRQLAGALGLRAEARTDTFAVSTLFTDLAAPTMFATHGRWRASERFTIGATWATDRRAPVAVERAAVVGAASLGAVKTEDGTAMTIDEAADVLALTGTYRLDDVWSLRANSGALLGGGFGLAAGVTADRSVGPGTLRFAAELTTYEGFVFGYFDGAYTSQRLRYGSGAAAAPKLAAIRGREGRRYGARVEADWSWADHLRLGAALALDSAGEDRHLMLRAAVPWSWANLYLLYQQSGFERPFTLEASDTLAGGARVALGSFVALDGRVETDTSWNGAAHDGLGAPQTDLAYRFDVEVGYPF